jgi:hypothetical protein
MGTTEWITLRDNEKSKVLLVRLLPETMRPFCNGKEIKKILLLRQKTGQKDIFFYPKICKN